MADLTQTAASVHPHGDNAQIVLVQVGEAVSQGEPGYLKAADSKYWKAVCTAEESAQAAGVFLTPASADGYAVMQKTGPIDLGATLAVGVTYCVSGTAGKIMPIADLASTNYVTYLGIATATDKLSLSPDAKGVQFA